MISRFITQCEGESYLLYRDPSNPYEDITIKARIENRCLTVTDEEYAYGPDGGYSVREISFDRENTLKVMEMLWQPPQNPFNVLAKTMTYRDRTQPFRDACTERGIHFENRLFW